jgi:apolipoprotein N-acyltransferase
MSTDFIVHIFALVFLILSFVWALITREISASLFAIWSIALIVVLAGFPWGR